LFDQQLIPYIATHLEHVFLFLFLFLLGRCSSQKPIRLQLILFYISACDTQTHDVIELIVRRVRAFNTSTVINVRAIQIYSTRPPTNTQARHALLYYIGLLGLL